MRPPSLSDWPARAFLISLVEQTASRATFFVVVRRTPCDESDIWGVDNRAGADDRRRLTARVHGEPEPKRSARSNQDAEPRTQDWPRAARLWLSPEGLGRSPCTAEKHRPITYWSTFSPSCLPSAPAVQACRCRNQREPHCGRGNASR